MISGVPGIQWAKIGAAVKAFFSDVKAEWHLSEKSQAVPLHERNGDFRVFRNETLIAIGKAQERLDNFDLLGFGPILNDLDFVGGHHEAARREYIA